jgi:phosphoribulokinase
VKFSESVLTSLSMAILAVTHRPVSVGIDGQGGAGKSTLARELVEVLPLRTAIVQGDDFYSEIPDDERALLSPEEGYERYFDWHRLKSEVLASIEDRAAALRYRKYDWDSGALGNWADIPMPEVVIVEGVYTLRAALRAAFDITVFVQAGEAARIARQVARAENSSEWIDRWIAAEDYYVARERPWDRADYVINGE